MEPLDALKMRLRNAVFQKHFSAMKGAEEILREIDRYEDQVVADPELWAPCVSKKDLSKEKGWFKELRRMYRACGRDREKQIRYIVEEVRRSFDRYYWYLVAGGSRAGFNVDDVRHLTTLLLKLDLTLPSLEQELDYDDAENAFHLLASAETLGIDELTGQAIGKPLKKLSFHEKRRLDKRRRVVAIAHLLRTWGQYLRREIAKRAAVRSVTSTGRPSSRDAFSPRGKCGPETTEPKPSRKCLADGDIAERKALYTKIRTIQADAIRKGRRVKDRDAWTQCRIDEDAFHRLRKNARSYGWPDPRDEAEKERRLAGRV